MGATEGGQSERPAVEVVALRRVFSTKNRPDVVALDGISLSIGDGEVHGLLGPNGAGKTTLVKILSTVLLPTSGTARVLGHDVVTDTAAVRQAIGIVFGGERGLYSRLTARQNLEYWAALYRLPSADGRRRADALLERVGLLERAGDRVQTYSKGMRQRLHLARGLISDPRVLFFDEPSAGMDPMAAHEFRMVLCELRSEGRTILLATHDMAEAETVCDRVTLIDRGGILATESPRSLSTMLSRFQRIECEGLDGPVLDSVGAWPGVTRVTSHDGTARIEVDGESVVAGVMAHLVAAGIVSLRVTRPSLEEVYLSLVGGRGLEL